MKSPKISVIVPVYNAEKTLRRCLDTILAQTYQDFELLLIDDGSNDGSDKICDEYAGKDFRVRVFHKPNGGASSARNIGLDNAKGEWITFCDADDYVFPNWIKNFELETTSTVDLIQQGTVCDKPLFGENGTLTKCGFDFEGEPCEYISDLFRQRMSGYLWIKAYKRNIISQFAIRFDSRLIFQEDEIFTYHYMEHVERVKSVNKQGYYYFVPDWEKYYTKISLNGWILLHEIKLNSLRNIFTDKRNHPIIHFHTNSLICDKMNSFATRPLFRTLLDIRRLINSDYEGVNLFTPLKWVIAKDSTRLISWPALLIHSNLRKWMGK